jgi:hypothetical protein
MLVSSLATRVRRAGFVVSLALGMSGCQKGDPEKCTQALSVVQKSLDAFDFAAAKQWREYAYKECEDRGQLANVDQSIVSRESQAAAAQAASAKLTADTNALAKVFFQFVADNRAAPDHASQAPVCDAPPEGAPADSKERFCSASRQAGSHTLEVRYYDADHTAFRFTTTPDGELDCKAMAGTVSKEWNVPAVGGKSAKRTRCELGGALSGLTAVVTGAQKAPLYVVSPSYVARDPGWRVILEGS